MASLTQEQLDEVIRHIRRDNGECLLGSGIGVNAEGYVVCECPKFKKVRRCEHVSKVINEESDVCFRETGGIWLGHLVVVPVWPTINFNVPVVVEDPDMGLDRHVKVGGLSLGYVGPSDGRKTIRSMIVAWLHVNAGRTCESDYHDGSRILTKSEIEKRKNPRDPETQRDTFSLLLTGNCWECQDTGVPDLASDAARNPFANRHPRP